MKYNKFYSNSLLILAAILLTTYVTNGQVSKESKKQDKLAQIESLVQSKNYVFIAQTAFPMGGHAINLTSVYNVKLSGDTVVSDLPYYGRAYEAPMNPSEGGMNFTSTKFSYDVKARKKGGWDISISPGDTKDVRQMFLTISSEGYATLQVGSNNRQNISFNGYITSKNKLR